MVLRCIFHLRYGIHQFLHQLHTYINSWSFHSTPIKSKQIICVSWKDLTIWVLVYLFLYAKGISVQMGFFSKIGNFFLKLGKPVAIFHWEIGWNSPVLHFSINILENVSLHNKIIFFFSETMFTVSHSWVLVWHGLGPRWLG
jgi:hypothetical protein